MAFAWEPYDNSRSSQTLAQIMQRLGLIQADRAREIARIQADRDARGGAMRGQMVADVGGNVAQTLGALLQERRDAPIRAAQAQQQAQRQAEDAELRGLQRQKLRADLEEPQQAQAKADREAQQRLALGEIFTSDRPESEKAAMAYRLAGAFGRDEFKAWKDLQPQTKTPEPFTLGPGQQRFGPDGQPIAAVPAKAPDAPTVGSFEDYLKRVAAEKNRPVETLSPKEIEAARKAYQQADDRPLMPPAPAFQSKEMLGDDGKPTTMNFDARTGSYRLPDGTPVKNPRPIPSAMEQMDSRKFQKAAPVLNGISELSERINTQQGLIAKISGAAEKAKAQANYNDDVAEYQSLVSGFTPMIARALGHTGVLTQQDVDSVKDLFPRPGDSKTLRDRKIKRMLGIISDLESVEIPGISGLAPAPRQRVKGPNGETGTVPHGTPLPPGWSVQ